MRKDEPRLLLELLFRCTEAKNGLFVKGHPWYVYPPLDVRRPRAKCIITLLK